MRVSLGNKDTTNGWYDDITRHARRGCSRAWKTMPLSSRATYQAQAAADEQRYNTEMVAYNDRIILSPSVHTSDGDSASEMRSGDEGYDVITNTRLELMIENKRRLLEHAGIATGKTTTKPAVMLRTLSLRNRSIS